MKISKVELELLTEEDKYLFVEKGIRGGISTITKRFAKANNERVAGYDPTDELTHLLYVDANNLYVSSYKKILIPHHPGYPYREEATNDL